MSDKSAIITGAARGLSREYILRPTSLGANVGVIDINLKSLEEYTAEKEPLTADTVMDEIKALGVNSVETVADIGNREQVFAVVEVIAGELGDISILVNNAGGGMSPMDGDKASQLSWEQFHAIVERDFPGTVCTCSTVAPIMKKLRYGEVVNVASMGGLMANDDGSYSHYVSPKAAIIHYTRSLAQELGPYNITYNVAAPGFILTTHLAAGYQAIGEEKFAYNIALGRFSTPGECANTVEFLAAGLSSYVSGAVLEITDSTVGRIPMNQ